MWLLDTNALISFAAENQNLKLFKENIIYTTIFYLIEYPVPKNFESMDVLYPSERDYIQSIRYSVKLRRKGTPIPAIDILIGGIAVSRDLYLVTNDRHFEILTRVEPQLKCINYHDFYEDLKKLTI